LIIVGGCAYVLDSSLALLAPDLRQRVSGLLLLPLAVGELCMVAWLIIKGVREPQVARSAS